MSGPDIPYDQLLSLRVGLRRFLRWSERCARAAGLTPAQHQLLLAVRGHGDPAGPTLGETAGYLMVRHHSVVGLVDRAVASGLLRRLTDANDHRAVRLRLTPKGERRLAALSELHLEELRRLRDSFERLGADLRERPVSRARRGARARRGR